MDNQFQRAWDDFSDQTSTQFYLSVFTGQQPSPQVQQQISQEYLESVAKPSKVEIMQADQPTYPELPTQVRTTNTQMTGQEIQETQRDAQLNVQNKEQQLDFTNLKLPFFTMTLSPDPGKENFLDMIKYSFFPDFSWSSMTAHICYLSLIIYVTALFNGLDKQMVLTPSKEGFIQTGALVPNLMIQERQYWRLLTSPFMFSNLIQFLLYLFNFVWMGANLEPMMDKWVIMAIWVCCSIGGGFIELLFETTSDRIIFSSLYGIIGITSVLISTFIQNWGVFNMILGRFRKSIFISLLVIMGVWTCLGSYVVILANIYSNFFIQQYFIGQIIGNVLYLIFVKPVIETQFTNTIKKQSIITAIVLIGLAAVWSYLFIYL